MNACRASRAGRALLVLALSLALRCTSAPGAPAGDVVSAVLPTGARQAIAAIRVFRALSLRNRTYRDARGAASHLRTHHDARIAMAKGQLARREQLGLRASQVQAHGRVVASLSAERDLALKLIEDEKRAAKYTFEGRLRRELVSALARTPRGQKGLRAVRDLFGDVRDAFAKARAALEGGARSRSRRRSSSRNWIDSAPRARC